MLCNVCFQRYQKPRLFWQLLCAQGQHCARHLVRLPAYYWTNKRGVEGRREREGGGGEEEKGKERQHLSCVLPQPLSVVAPKPDCLEREEGKGLSGWGGRHTALIPEETFGVQAIQTHCLAGSSFLGLQLATDFPRPGSRGVLAAMGQGPRQSLSG